MVNRENRSGGGAQHDAPRCITHCQSARGPGLSKQGDPKLDNGRRFPGKHAKSNLQSSPNRVPDTLLSVELFWMELECEANAESLLPDVQSMDYG